MAIQGIIHGYAKPDDHAQHVVLVGRGASYLIIINGRWWGYQSDSLMLATRAWRRELINKPDSWVRVRTMATDELGNHEIRSVCNNTLGEWGSST